MRSNLLQYVALSCFLFASQAFAGWADIGDPAELRALHANTTLKARRGAIFYGHFYDGGAVVMFDKGVRVRGTWHLSGDHAVCTRAAEGSECYRFQKTGDFDTEYRAIRVSDGAEIPLVVEHGVPGL